MKADDKKMAKENQTKVKVALMADKKKQREEVEEKMKVSLEAPKAYVANVLDDKTFTHN